MSENAARVRKMRANGESSNSRQVSQVRDHARAAPHLIRRARQIIWSVVSGEIEEFGITPNQFGVMTAIRQHPGIDQHSLSLGHAMDRATLATMIKRLREKGLIKVEPDPGDRRSKRLSLSELGEAVIEAAFPRVEFAEDRCLAALTKKEREQFIRLLQKFVRINGAYSRVPHTSLGESTE